MALPLRRVEAPPGGRARRHLGPNLTAGLLLAPLTALLLAEFFYPLALTLVTSFQSQAPGLTTATYAHLFAQPAFRQVVELTLGLALGSTLISLVLSLGLAFWIRSWPWAGPYLTYLMLIPALIPALVGALGLLLLYDRTGWFNLFLLATHLRQQPVKIDYTIPGLILFYTWMFFPYGGLVLSSGLQSIGREVEEAARVCGADRATVLGRVTLPLLLPSLISATILIFLQAFGAFSIPLIVGGNYQPLAVRIYTVATVFLEWHQASAMAMVMAAIQVALLSLYGWSSRQPTRR